jgi:hypothetical protein
MADLAMMEIEQELEPKSCIEENMGKYPKQCCHSGVQT